MRRRGLVLLIQFFCILSFADPGGQKPPQQQKPAEQKFGAEINMDGVVEVSLKIDSAGNIQIIDLQSSNPKLSEYVLGKLSQTKLSSNSSDSGKVVKYRFVFKKQT